MLVHHAAAGWWRHLQDLLDTSRWGCHQLSLVKQSDNGISCCVAGADGGSVSSGSLHIPPGKERNLLPGVLQPTGSLSAGRLEEL